MAEEEERNEIEGTIIKLLPNTHFTVKLNNDHEVLADFSARMRKLHSRPILLGDRVLVEMTKYNRCRILYHCRH